MIMLVVTIVVGIQGWLESQGRKIWKSGKKSTAKIYPKDTSVGVSGIGRSMILGGKAFFFLCGPSIFIFICNDFYLNIRNVIVPSKFWS